VQGGWRRYKKRKLARELMKQEGIYYQDANDGGAGAGSVEDGGYGAGLGGGGDGGVDADGAPLLAEFSKGAVAGADGSAEVAGTNSADDSAGAAHLSATFLASKFAKNTKRGAAVQQKRIDDVAGIKFPKVTKPDEPTSPCTPMTCSEPPSFCIASCTRRSSPPPPPPLSIVGYTLNRYSRCVGVTEQRRCTVY
jgi:cyclic nucleotide gated channel